MTLQLKGWHLAILAAVAVLLAFLVFRGCSKETSSIPAIVTKTNKEDAAHKRVADSLAFQNALLKDTLKVLRTNVSVVKKKLSSAEADLSYWVLRGQRVKTDTTQYLINCDSLSESSNQLIGLIRMYEDKASELQTGTDSLVVQQEREIQAKDDMYYALRNNFDTLAVTSLKEFNHVNKKLKRNTFLNRVLAGALLVGAGLYLAK